MFAIDNKTVLIYIVALLSSLYNELIVVRHLLYHFTSNFNLLYYLGRYGVLRSEVR